MQKSRSTEKVKVLSVAPYQVVGMGVGPQLCYLVQEEGSDEWQLFYTRIHGFTFEAGMSYRLKVKERPVEMPPADGSSLRYDLMEVLEKKKEVQPLQDLQGHWRVFRLNGRQGVPEGVGQTMEIDITAMTLRGYGGSNRYQARLTNADGSPEIGVEQMVSTRRFGPHQQQEDLFFGALERVDGYYCYDSSLLLLAGGQVIVEARRLEP